jgi:putative tricarboxylic transport membrane protein
MSQERQAATGGTRTVVVDLVTALLIFLVGSLVAWDSYRLGASWGAEGPQAGYFPFYIGLLICISSAVVFGQSLAKLGKDRSVFVQREQFRQVLVILLPSTAYVLVVQFLGIYVASAVFICLFMRIVGKYSWLRSAAVGVAVSAVVFPVFEIWFTIPLPKGPLEALFGY